jgi:DNA-binding Lrp family transcriptional regulator
LNAKAFLLISAEIGREKDVASELEAIPNVREVHVTYGVYDVIAKVEAETPEKLKETITNKIRTLEHIKSTLTMVVVEES